MGIERRTEPRIAWNCPVRVTLLDSSREEFDATLVNISGRGARLKADRPLECDSVIRIDVGQGMLLGEVCYSATDGDGFGIGVQLEHSLVNLDEITNMRNRVLGEATSREPAPTH